jgi:hypothetical protein
VYLIWGGTYAAIRVGVMSLPPAALSGGRFTIAGIGMTLYAIARDIACRRRVANGAFLFSASLRSSSATAP